MKEKNRYLLKLGLLMSIPIIFSEYLFRTRITEVLQMFYIYPG